MEEPEENPTPAAPIQPTDVKLTSDEITEAVDFINAKAISKTDACPVCGSSNNSVTENVYRVNVRTEPTAIIGGRYQPLVTTVCNNCGYVRFFNQNMMRYIRELEEQIKQEAAAAAPPAEAPDGK